MAKKIKKPHKRPLVHGRKNHKVPSSPSKVNSQQELLQQALALHQAGRLAEAEVFYRQILAVEPNHPDALHFLGMLANQVGNSEAAVALISQALCQRPEYVAAYNNLGIILNDQGKPDEAAASLRRALTLHPDFAEAHYNLGNALMNMGKLDEAVKSFDQAITLKPDYAKAYNNRGNTLNALGKLEEAVASYRRALSLKPDYVEAYRALSSIEKHNDYDFSIKEKEDLYAGKVLSGEARMHLGFALGKIFADLKQYDKSFGFILEANQLQRQSYEYSIQSDRELFKKIKSIFSTEFFSSHKDVGNPDETPIFIIGMPRSGTSLVEQILASHPLAFGAGELHDLKDLIGSLCTGGSAGEFPDCVSRLGAAALEKIGSDYIAKIRRHSKEARHITDKMPHNFFHVGLIKVILPNARIIHCRRDPMDNCLSIFKTYFSSERGSHPYAYDLTELGQYYRLYRDLMQHWERVLPGAMYTLNYEDLVADQKTQTAQLLEFCGLSWDDACLAFHKTKRVVQTASFAQVRKPLYNDSVKLWKRYEAQLDPLRKALEGI